MAPFSSLNSFARFPSSGSNRSSPLNSWMMTWAALPSTPPLNSTELWLCFRSIASFQPCCWPFSPRSSIRIVAAFSKTCRLTQKCSSLIPITLIPSHLEKTHSCKGYVWAHLNSSGFCSWAQTIALIRFHANSSFRSINKSLTLFRTFRHHCQNFNMTMSKKSSTLFSILVFRLIFYLAVKTFFDWPVTKVLFNQLCLAILEQGYCFLLAWLFCYLCSKIMASGLRWFKFSGIAFYPIFIPN